MASEAKRPKPAKKEASPSGPSRQEPARGQDSALIARTALLHSAAGEPPPVETRARVEAVTGARLDRVRVHTGIAARRASEELDALAFTYRQDIFFGSEAGPSHQALLAHELAQAAQQSGAPGVQRATGEASTDAAEVEADSVADEARSARVPVLVDDDVAESRSTRRR